MLVDFRQKNFQNFFNAVRRFGVNYTLDNGSAYYGYIPMTRIDFPSYDLPIAENAKIVDLGCGYCENLVYLGSTYNTSDLHGVEINPKYFNDVSEVISEFEMPITLYNESYNEHDISEYDVIYSFCIAQKNPEYTTFNQYVLDNMKEGAIWIEALSEHPDGFGSVVEAIENSENNFEILYHENKVIAVKKL